MVRSSEEVLVWCVVMWAMLCCRDGSKFFFLSFVQYFTYLWSKETSAPCETGAKSVPPQKIIDLGLTIANNLRWRKHPWLHW